MRWLAEEEEQKKLEEERQKQEEKCQKRLEEVEKRFEVQMKRKKELEEAKQGKRVMHGEEAGLQFSRDAEGEGGKKGDSRGRDYLQQCTSTSGGVVGWFYGTDGLTDRRGQ